MEKNRIRFNDLRKYSDEEVATAFSILKEQNYELYKNFVENGINTDEGGAANNIYRILIQSGLVRKDQTTDLGALLIQMRLKITG